MARSVRVSVERSVAASPERVYQMLADYRDTRRRILTANYLDYQVEEGGTGAGTVISYRLQAAGRERSYRLRVETPAINTLVERDTASSLVTTWRVMRAPNAASIVRLVTEWQAAPGIRGLFERTFAPRRLRRIYDELLRRAEEVLTS